MTAPRLINFPIKFSFVAACNILKISSLFDEVDAITRQTKNSPKMLDIKPKKSPKIISFLIIQFPVF